MLSDISLRAKKRRAGPEPKLCPASGWIAVSTVVPASILEGVDIAVVQPASFVRRSGGDMIKLLFKSPNMLTRTSCFEYTGWGEFRSFSPISCTAL